MGRESHTRATRAPVDPPIGSKGVDLAACLICLFLGDPAVMGCGMSAETRRTRHRHIRLDIGLLDKLPDEHLDVGQDLFPGEQ